MGPAGVRGKYGRQNRDQIQWAGPVTVRAQARLIHVALIKILIMGRRFFFEGYEDRQKPCHAVEHQQLGSHDHVQRGRGRRSKKQGQGYSDGGLRRTLPERIGPMRPGIMKHGIAVLFSEKMRCRQGHFTV